VAAPSGQEEDDPLREARAYNNSIYLMVGTPYLLLSVFGVMVYRGVKKNQALKRAAGGLVTGPEDLPCSPLPSAVETPSPSD
jgi:hypothetical protein